MKSHILTILTFTGLCVNGLFSQNESVLLQTNRAALLQLADQWKSEWRTKYEEGKAVVEAQGREVRTEDENGRIVELRGKDEAGHLLFMTTDNRIAARTISTNRIWPGAALGFTLNGSGMTVGEWDGGRARASHQELVGRVIHGDTTSSNVDHATHVAGTLIASGVDSNAKGMAYGASLLSYDWNFDNSEMATAAAGGLLLSNHSYGTITGWYYNSSLSEWEWWGDTTLGGTEDFKFGYYSSLSVQWDQISRNAPYYLIVKSAGNDRGETGTGRHYLPQHSTYSSVSRPADGAPSGYDCISMNSGAKNILTVGAVNDIAGGYNGTSSVVMSAFSGWGPTDDGRIKPDIVANGIGLYSSLSTTNSTYASWNGTSMAAPNVTGSLLLLQELYNDLNSASMKSATLKALVIHTADEAGAAPGPDYIYGWGLMNAASAALHIADTSGSKDISEATLNNSQTYTFPLNANGTSPIKVTICWTDIAGSPVAASVDPSTRMLVNDLDLRIIRNSDSTIYYPYILNPSSPSSAATSGDNIRDNVEKIYIASPVAGAYTVVVSHKGSLSGGSQDFSIIIDGGNIPHIPPTCLLQINAFPAFEGFDSYSNCSSTASAMCALPAPGGWQNDLTDNIDWKVYSGTTPTANTGPTNDYSLGTSAGKFLYTESSTNGTGYPNKKAVLYSPCYNLDTLLSPELSFAYSMYGATMGSLTVEVYNGFGWTPVWSRSGDQGNSWHLAVVNLSAFAGDTTKIRFVGITGSNITSDMAIDAIEVRERDGCSDPQNPVVYGITDSSATLSWNSTSIYHTIRLHLADSIQILKATVSFNPVLMNGLFPNTSYDVFILDSCGLGDTSNWVGPIRFRTTGPLSNPSDCGLDLIIPDGACPNLTTFPIEVTINGSQLGINVWLKEVRLILEHPWVSDMVIYLANPTNDTILLTAYNGGSGDNYGNPSDTTCTLVTNFSRLATATIASGIAPFVGNYLPQDSLNLLENGGNPNGLWKLLVCDYYAADTGYLHFIELVFDTLTCTPPVVSISNSGNDSICQGTSTVLYTGGGISYQWYRNGQQIQNATNDSLVVNSNGLYNVMVTVTGSCSDSALIGSRIVVNALPSVSISNSGNSAFCQGSSVTLSTSGGAQYQWYRNGQMLGGANSSSLLVSSAGRYNVWVTNVNSCSDSSTVPRVITVYNLPTVTITPGGATAFCSGNSVLLSTIAASSYQWRRNGSVISGANSSSYSAVTSGFYNVIVTNANNCSDSASSAIGVVVHPLPGPVITVLGSATICQGDTAQLSAPSGFSQYAWYRNGNLVTGASQQNIYASAAGLYNVVVTNLNNCSDSALIAILVVVNPLPVASIIADKVEFCEGDSATITATSGFNYDWYRSGILISNAHGVNLVTGDPGTYNVMVTDNNSCSDTAQIPVSLIVHDLPVVSIGSLQNLCNIDPATLLSGGSPVGGIYSGVAVSNLSGQYFFDPSLAGTGTHNILYTFMDANNCSDSALTTLTVENCVGIESHNIPALHLYPNPTNGIVFITASTELRGEIILTVYDLQGRTMTERRLLEKVANDPIELDMTSFSEGTYLITITGDEINLRQKIILDKNFLRWK